MAIVREAFSRAEGVMAVMMLANVNTDAIIPSAWLRATNADLAKGLFGGHRYDEAGNERPDFVLNKPVFRNAAILLADENFGCGSSREAAVWALSQFGIRCVLAPSFADIFYENAFRNGLLPGLIDAATMQALAASVARHPAGPVFKVDLPTAIITDPDGGRHSFSVPPLRAEALIKGYDEIDMTMRHTTEIEAHYAKVRTTSGWLFPESVRGRHET